MRSHISKLVTSRFFQKWCSNGVVSAFPLRETIDFTGFSGTFQDTAVADEQYIYHRFELLLQVVMYRLYHREAGVPIVRYSRNAQGAAALSAAAP